MIRPVVSFRAVKVGKKCKHLSNFLAVTLQALCLSYTKASLKRVCFGAMLAWLLALTELTRYSQEVTM
jgi:hypothetical protein